MQSGVSLKKHADSPVGLSLRNYNRHILLYISDDMSVDDHNAINAALKKDSVSVRLLCGADLLESFGTPGLWADKDVNSKTHHKSPNSITQPFSILVNHTLKNFILKICL